ncbi:MAG: DUF2232 domain-containing protein, partial [Nitrospinaceae bacterium]|nr:DUF2232 domain-containing protein [Nitrospinaceae bacterium]NIR54555.1 DUF2232 domain-containing protein [Nitrospinaceae bacterium]NIS84974.1 DUF2232 domain-containing protein [Nitrospinaceae bacterium]NIT84073.1 DUF2232 domain-containing protein [Nitrospinaceae bacterium]NIU44057.1 DUF2232 domain-containing protein [Nitrospinaceae bacterium]
LIALVFGVLLALMGMTQAMMFLAEYAVMAILMAETIRMGLPLDRSIFFSALAATVVSLVLLFVMFSDRETTGSGFFQEQIQKHFDESMKTLE